MGYTRTHTDTHIHICEFCLIYVRGWANMQVTKRVDTAEGSWKGWNWRSEGDVMVNGAFFVASGDGVEVKYEKAYSVEPKSAVLIEQLTMHAGTLGVGSR